jgi:outer membrane lipoprotein-sorting protein
MSFQKKCSRFFTGLGVITGLMFSTPSDAALTAPEQKALDQVATYMDGFKTLKGQFVQVGPDGVVSEGQFAMSKPGKMRFEYRPPTPILIISDGFWVSLEDTELKTQDRYPLSSTPLGVLLQEKFQTKGEHMEISDVKLDKGSVEIVAFDPTSKDQGKINLVFSTDPFALQQWTVTDAQGLKTTVSLDNLAFGTPVDPKSFYIENNVKQGNTRFKK